MLTGNVRYDYLEFPKNYTVIQVLNTLGKFKYLPFNLILCLGGHRNIACIYSAQLLYSTRISRLVVVIKENLKTTEILKLHIL